MNRHLCIEVHDVAPATWPQCLRLLQLLDALGAAPVTLLVVPDFHGRGHVGASPPVARALRAHADRGAEIALHGYYHRDDGPPPRTPWDWLRRRVLTNREGEFSALTQDQAAHRIRRGCDELSDLFAPVHGFVAPAWLHNADTFAALRRSPLRYVATRRELITLNGTRRVAAPVLTVSARSGWRSGASRLWLRAFARATAAASLLRVALHPVDAEHSEMLAAWHQTLQLLLVRRTPITLGQALDIR